MLCIIFMISVHVWPGATKVLAADIPFHTFYVVLIEYLGRASVSLLGVVSGVLLAQSFGKTAPLTLLSRKARSLLVPMVLWSAAVLGLYVADAVLTGDTSHIPTDAIGWINALFALTEPPANLPLAFLRDVFMCAVIGIFALSQGRAVCLAILAGAVALETTTSGVLLLRPQILAFFATGIGLSMFRLADYVPRRRFVLLMLALDVALHQNIPADVVALDYLNRIAMSLLLWRCAVDLRDFKPIKSLEPYIFVIFCSHVIAISAIGFLARSSGVSVSDAVYPLIFLLQFPIIIGVGVGFSLALRAGRSGYP